MWRALTIHSRSAQPLMEGDLVDVSKAVTSYGGLDRSLVRRWVAQLVSSPPLFMSCLSPAFRHIPTVIMNICWLTAWGTVLIVFAPSDPFFYLCSSALGGAPAQGLSVVYH